MSVVLRDATDTDARPLLELINGHALRGLLLPRSEASLRERLGDFIVAESAGELVGCGALSGLGPGLGEVRSLAVRDDHAGNGLGRAIVERLVEGAAERGFREVIALTRRTSFFARLGFQETQRERFLDKLRADCAACPKNLCCDETAMVRRTRAGFEVGEDMGKLKKIVLAYSGGLDTSIIIPWLQENYGGEIVAYCGDVGQGDDLEAVARKALATGASKCIVEDLREEFIRDYAFKALAAGAVYEDHYLLGTALARPLLAKKQVEAALREGADALAHGATGKGNDQVRFEVTYGAFAPQLTVIAPWREWSIRSREDALAYAAARGVPVDQSPRDLFSRDGNLWHLSHEGGNLEDAWDAPQKEMFKLTVDPADAPDTPEQLTLAFERGVPVAINGAALGPVAIVETLNALAGAHGVGRLDLVENRLVGIKSRGVYETPAGTVLHFAHRELERLVLDRDTLHFKQAVSVRYAQLIYDGLWFSTLREALATFVDFTEQEVTGEVRLRLFKGRVEILGRRAPRSLYRQDLATFGEGMAYDHKDAAGFIKLFGLPERVRALTRAPQPETAATTKQVTEVGS